jgi:argininosuccinate lyase
VTIAKTEAGGAGLLPEVLAFTSSLSLDRQLLREDLLGSLAHLAMLSRRRVIPAREAALIRKGLVGLWPGKDGAALDLPDEEDVHMAVEARLTAQLGREVAGLLHTARSRNDQVALDLRLHVREQIALALEQLAAVIAQLAERADASKDVLLPSYTHRQRAQPVSLAYVLCAWGAMLARDVEALQFALSQTDALALGVGAVGGTSIPIDREITRGLLRFARTTLNGMDTVGDRDFALDFSYATARCLLHVSRISTDVIDFASAEFGFVKLDGEIACGSSMMPQKKNPDVFELLRGRTGRAVGNLMGLFTTLKGLPGGYNRDLQEDRQPLLETGPLLSAALSALHTALPRVHFDAARTRAALESDYTQATDLAEALALEGVPFRVAYQAVGQLVRRCQERGLPLAQVPPELAREVHPLLEGKVLRAADPATTVARKANQGGTGPASVAAQIAVLRSRAADARAKAAAVPRLDALFAEVSQASLE